MRLATALACGLLLLASDGAPAPARAAEPLSVAVTYLGRDEPPVAPLSLVEPILKDEGRQGVAQAVRDNQTTGRFLKHDYWLVERVVPQGGGACLDPNHGCGVDSGLGRCRRGRGRDGRVV
jgi:hypothetical protein